MNAPQRDAVGLEFHADAAGFLAAAGQYLASDPVIATVVTGMAHRVVSQLAEGIPQPDRDWWLTVTDESGAVVGAGMRTAHFEPHPPFLLPMPDEAAVTLAQVLHERGEEVLAINGALLPVELCAAKLAQLGGGQVKVAQHTRLHELDALVMPSSVPGELVLVSEGDVELAARWFAAFMGDADAQAGRERGASAHDLPDRAELLRRIKAGLLWFWINDSSAPVHLIGVNPPSFGVARVGPVYTPPSQRGRGWASNAVAEVSRKLQADGARVCLYTDQANPTSNKIYAALGFRPVVDMANLLIVR
jgi:predicted GNAT family acetyltransferase